MTRTAIHTRDKLIETAMRLFHEHGYAATGVARILDEAGARSGSLYHFFPSKEALLLAVLERYKQVLWPIVIEPVFDRVKDPIERVFGILEGYKQALVATDCTGGCPIGNLALELADAHAHIRQAIAESFEGWRLAVKQCLDDAGDALPGGLDRDRLATFILTVMEGGIMQARAHKSTTPFDDSVAMLRDYFDRLLAAPGAGPRMIPKRPPEKGRA